MAIVVEVLQDGAAGPAQLDDAAQGCNVLERPDVVFRLEVLRRNQPPAGHARWILAELHVSDVEQPAVKQCAVGIDRRVLKQRLEALGGLGGAELLFVHSTCFERQDAHVGTRIGRAVLLLTDAEIGKR